MRRILLLSLIGLLLLVTEACADPVTRYVPDEYYSIQQAIQDSNDGDTVIVRPGLYFELINFSGKNITVTSEDPNDPWVVAQTILNGDDDGTVVTFDSGETRQAVLAGFTINSGYGTYDERFGSQELLWGAGIFVADSSPTIRNNFISENFGPVETGDYELISYGGGLACINSEALVVNNTFCDNSAAAGGAIMVWSGPTELRSNLIYNNSAAIGGGVVLLGGKLINCTVVNNDADLAGPFGEDVMAGNVYVASQGEDDWNRCVVKNNIICYAKSGYGMFLASDGTTNKDIAFNDIWGNLPADAYGIDPRTGQMPDNGLVDLSGWNGNISENPLLVDVTDDEFHLLLDSPCINTGDPEYVPAPGEKDMDGQQRVYAVVVDMGADEYIGYIKPVADAGSDIHVFAPELVTLDGTNSFFYDPCGIKIFHWTQIDGPPLDPNDPNSTEFYQVQLSDPASAQPTFMPGPEGYYWFELNVSDDDYEGRSDQVLVIVGNKKPVADAGLNQVTQVPAIVYLDASDSYDPDPTDELTYKWTQVEGPVVKLSDPNSATPYFDCNEGGVFVFELVVNDGFEDSLPTSVRITTVAVTLNLQSLEFGLDDDLYNQSCPDISGSRVVFAAGPGWHDALDIVVKNLNSGEVSTFIAGGIDTQPKIDGDLVVWAGGPSGYDYYIYNSIFAANIVTNVQVPLEWASTTNRIAYARPVISGKKVVWLRFRNINEVDWYSSSYDICGADITDLSHPVRFTIAENTGTHAPYDIDMFYYDYDDVLDISGDTVVWESNGDIMGADISDIENIKTFTICDHSARQYNPAISDNIVVWTDERNDSGDIYGADISDINNITEFTVAKASGMESQPAIDGCLIAYISGSQYGGTINACCVTKNFEILKINLNNYPYGLGPAVDGDKIVYQAGAINYAEGFSMGFGYSSADGPVHNVFTGQNYDYIQHAVYAAQDGEKIVVDQGIYDENIDIRNKNITISSQNPEDPDVTAATVITGDGVIVSFSGGVEPNCLLEGFTVSGGNIGIYCYDSAPSIKKCVITDNSSHGLELHKESNALIDRCLIADNGGAGINMVVVVQGRLTFYNRPIVTNCIIASNAGDGFYGGGPIISNCTIVQNGLRGIYSNMRVDSTVTNSIIYYNGQASGSPQISNSRAAVTYSNVQDSFNGLGNIDIEPNFESLAHWEDPQQPGDEPLWIPGNYRLLVGSPCIDSGDPNCQIELDAKDFDGKKRLVGGAVDIGAYEIQPAQSRIEVSQPRFEFEVVIGKPVEDQLLLVENVGTGTLNWQISCESNWLRISPLSGTSPGGSNNVWLKVDPTSLTAGQHNCELIVSDPNASNNPVTIEVQLTIQKNCFPDTPEYADQYGDFLQYIANGADPSCWCAPPHGSGYQCDGDADGQVNPYSQHRIYANDLALLIKNWKAKIDTADPCADFDHKASRIGGFRVFVDDLNILISNWKKTNDQLPGDCPRADVK